MTNDMEKITSDLPEEQTDRGCNHTPTNSSKKSMEKTLIPTGNKEDLKYWIACFLACNSAISIFWGTAILMEEPLFPIYRYVEIGVNEYGMWQNFGAIIQMVFLIYFYVVAIPVTFAFTKSKAFRGMVVAGPLMLAGFVLFCIAVVSCTGGA